MHIEMRKENPSNKTGKVISTGPAIQNGNHENNMPEILFICTFPPRECGIATYSQDLIKAINKKFGNSFRISVCALENENEKHSYPEEVKYVFDTSQPDSYINFAETINENDNIRMVLIQHEFGFFYRHEEEFATFLESLNKPSLIVFHTVLPKPDSVFRERVERISNACDSIIVMTDNSAGMLTTDYSVDHHKVHVIPHGTHLVPHLNRDILKEKDGFNNRRILSTFGLLSSGKSIETTLDALPEVVSRHPDVLFLVIGKTHPNVVKEEGEKYRNFLEAKVKELNLEKHVQFVNYYLPLSELLEYLQLTDIYLFTSKDPNQAVSGTFSYAMSCGCAIISTPIPHAREVLDEGAGIIFDFGNSKQLSFEINKLLDDEQLRKNISLNALHRIISTSWENSAVAHTMLLEKLVGEELDIDYSLPPVNLNHVIKLTTDFGMIQFSILNHPDIESGYTLDDNSRALIAMCQHLKLSGDKTDVSEIRTYFNFIKYCFQPEGYFLNYVNEQKIFTDQNHSDNIADSNGRAVWALGYLISVSEFLPEELVAEAKKIIKWVLPHIDSINSTRAMAFAIKGLHYTNSQLRSPEYTLLIRTLADRLVQMYRHESEDGWNWYESYLTYANSVIPEALLCAFEETQDEVYRDIALNSFRFLLTKTFEGDRIKIISNKTWLKKGEKLQPAKGGEQPIDVAYTVLTLSRFYDVFNDEEYLHKMKSAFNWFLGDNHLRQIIYNPCTGGCYDGLEENYVNLNQGAESTVSYLMARFAVAPYYVKSTSEAYKADLHVSTL
jgi:glycosyltransferase involved in cell wall biosynthesis